MYPTSLPLPPPSLLSSSSSPLQPHQPHPLPHPQSATATATASVSKKKKDGVDVIVRGPLDIIMGRGCHDNKSGNERLKQLVGMYYEQYNTTRLKNGKSALVANIYQQIQQSGSRFLVKSKDTPGHWIIAAYKKAYNKISHDFRNMRLKVALATTTTTSTMDADVPIKRPAHIMATTDTNIINSTTTTTDIIQSKYKGKSTNIYKYIYIYIYTPYILTYYHPSLISFTFFLFSDPDTILMCPPPHDINTK